jgi:HTH-type transcriptional regulator, bacterioopsin transcriptional activator and related proteins
MGDRGPTEQYSLETIYSTFTDQEHSTTPLTASDVATAAGCARRTAYEKLQQLTAQGRLQTKKVGAHSRIWWRAPETPSEPLHSQLLSRDLQTLFDRMLDAVFILDTEWQFHYLNKQAEQLLDCTADEIRSEKIWDAFPHPKRVAFMAEYQQSMETQTPSSFDAPFPPLETWFEQNVYPFETGLVVQLRDITDQKQREQNLSRYQTIIETIWDGVYALDADHTFTLVNDAYTDLTGYSRDELLGSPATIVHNEEINTAATQLSAAVETGTQQEATIEFELERPDETTVPVEAKFGPSPLDTERGGRVGVVRDVTERNRREQRLQQQREQLAALNHLHRVVQDIIQSLVQQSTREELCQLVCDRLASAAPYDAAWIGQVDWVHDDVTIQSQTGLSADYDDYSLSFADDDDVLTTVIQNQEVRVIGTEPAIESRGLREQLPAFEEGAVAVVPLVHEETVYGLVGIATKRSDSFDGYERTVIEQLGAITGHALSALDRKEALMADDRIELEFYIEDLFGELELPETTGTITFDRTIPVHDDTFLEYGTATPGALQTLHALVDQLPHFEDVTILDDDSDRLQFELRLTEPPVISVLASHGGRVQTARIASGDYHMTVEIPTSVDTHQIITAVQNSYPMADVVAQRHLTDPYHVPEASHASVLEQLTDRQEAVLEAAYVAGYFEWPRERTGEDVAHSLDIKAPTFHKHLRKAEQTIMDKLLTAEG